MAQGDVAAASTQLAKAEHVARQRHFTAQMPAVAAAQVRVLLHQGNLVATEQLMQMHELPISQARIHLAQGDPSAALAVLEPARQQAEAKGWADERLKVLVLEAVACHALGKKTKALQRLGAVLALAAPGGFIRIFVDEGMPMADLLAEAAAHGMMPDYTGKLLTAFEDERQQREDALCLPPSPAAQILSEPLSQRELENLGADRCRPQEPGNRRSLSYQPQYRPLPRQKHLWQTRRQQARPRHCSRT